MQLPDSWSDQRPERNPREMRRNASAKILGKAMPPGLVPGRKSSSVRNIIHSLHKISWVVYCLFLLP